MPFLFALLLAVTAPAEDLTSWMSLESFHLSIGMPRAAAMRTLEAWNPKAGKHPDQVVVDYKGDKAMTLEFRKDRLHSVRFELFVFLPQARKAFGETRERLATTWGTPRLETKSVLVYDTFLPNLMVVVSDDPKSENGKKGVGILAVRYYDPRD